MNGSQWGSGLGISSTDIAGAAGGRVALAVKGGRQDRPHRKHAAIRPDPPGAPPAPHHAPPPAPPPGPPCPPPTPPRPAPPPPHPPPPPPPRPPPPPPP